ncbi:MAG: DUF1015 domain-containing protein [Cyclobacteriaceae bacterium]
MAEIRPLRAWRYNRELGKNIADFISPLFDVVSQKQRDKLYANELNSIHLSVPLGDHPDITAKKTLEEWKKEGIIEQDLLPAIYVYYQYFSLPGSDKEYVRKGFIANIRIYNWDEKVILRHENTIPHSVSDRKKLVEVTNLNVSPTHGLYTDETHSIEKYLDEAILNPVYETEDYQGVKDVLAIIHDATIIRDIVGRIENKQIILADGHHRYEGSLQHMNEMKAQNPEHDGTEGYNYHLMYFTNTEADDLRVLPTHRLVRDLENFDEEKLLEKLAEDFFIKPIDEISDINQIILGKKWAFGLIIDERAYKIRLKPEKIDEIPWNFPQKVKEIDLTILHYFFFEKALGVPGKEQRDMKNVVFERNFTECVSRVFRKEANFAIITKEVPISTIKEVCYSGYTMPQKSTYFYPKVICGYLFSSIENDEFKLPVDIGL